MSDIAKRVIQLREAIETATAEDNQLEGQILQVTTRLKEEFNCSSSKAAKAEHAKLLLISEEAEAKLVDILKAMEEKINEFDAATG